MHGQPNIKIVNYSDDDVDSRRNVATMNNEW
jgi:hypothetical protein